MDAIKRGIGMEWTAMADTLGMTREGVLGGGASAQVFVYVGIGVLCLAMALMLQLARRRADD